MKKLLISIFITTCFVQVGSANSHALFIDELVETKELRLIKYIEGPVRRASERTNYHCSETLSFRGETITGFDDYTREEVLKKVIFIQDNPMIVHFGEFLYYDSINNGSTYPTGNQGEFLRSSWGTGFFGIIPQYFRRTVTLTGDEDQFKAVYTHEANRGLGKIKITEKSLYHFKRLNESEVELTNIDFYRDASTRKPYIRDNYYKCLYEIIRD